MRRLVLGLTSCFIFLPHAIQAATFTVTDTADVIDAHPGDGICETATGNGICTLRAAIQESNALAGSDTVNLPAGTYTLTIPGTDEDMSASGDLDITDDLTIIGAGQRSTIVDGNGTDRVFHILQKRSVAFLELTIRNGDAISTATPTGYQGIGGGILSFGDLQLNNVTVSGNHAYFNGGGI